MKKIFFLSLCVLLLIIEANISSAQTCEIFLNAGSSTVQAGLDVEHKLDQGKLLTGLNGTLVNDEGRLRLIEGHLAIGNDMLTTGLSGKLGIKGFAGSADRSFRDSNIGGLGFMIGGAYSLPKASFPISTKVFADLSFSPGPLCFTDLDRYFDMKMGVDFYLVENAALELAYQHYSLRMKNGPGDWSRRDDFLTIGVKLRF
jgi:hypothetical protein